MNFLKNKSKKERILTLLLSAFLLLSIIFLISSKSRQDGLAVYTNENNINIWDNEDSSNLDLPMKSYSDKTLNLSFSVPENWKQKKSKDGVAFTHEDSGSIFRMEISKYDPAVNNFTAESISSFLVESGYTFVNYSRLSATAYQILYQQKGNDTNDFIQTVYWDRKNIVTLSCIFNDANYKNIIPYYDKILSSFKWVQEKPVPAGYIMYYNPVAKFEVAVPEGWIIQSGEAQAVFADEATQASAVISVVANKSYLSSLRATDITDSLKSGKSNFIMKDYSTSKKEAYALCTYTQNDKQVIYHQYIIANGKKHIYLSMHCYPGTLDDSIISTMRASLKVYK